MIKETYTVNIGNLKISGPPEDLRKLAHVYSCAAWNYESLIVNEMNRKNRDDTLIANLKVGQKEFKNIGKHIIDAIRNSEHYKEFVSKRANLINKFLNKIESQK